MQLSIDEVGDMNEMLIVQAVNEQAAADAARSKARREQRQKGR